MKHANTIETGSGRNGEKLVEASSTKRSTREALWRRSYLASLVPLDVSFQLHSVFPGAFSLPRSSCKFVMQIDFQLSDSSCLPRETYPTYSFIIKPSWLIRCRVFAMTQIIALTETQ